MNEKEKLLRLQTMLLCDVVPKRPIPAYLVGETKDNQDSVFERAVELNRLWPWPIQAFAISGGQTNGYPGAETYVNELIRSGIRREQIAIIDCEEQLNTKTEMMALARYTKDQVWKEMVLVAPPFHQLRSFLTLLGAMRRLGMQKYLRVYSLPGVPQPWQQIAIHSQGVVRSTREELISSELKRIQNYSKKGDLVTVDEALAYLHQRNSI